ncbi:hypothetical protein [Streptomyces sp. NPDC059008]|uniref:hypothetical protein n=1 Tax=unclassified Streptomyces TaxID=2593676 RepID=UPI0036938EB5
MKASAIAKSAGVLSVAAALSLGAATSSFAADRWQDSWTTNGGTQTTAAHHVSKGKHFLHMSIKGNGRHSFTAKAYKVVGGKGGGNDKLIQTIKWKDNFTEYMADWKNYSEGSYYLVFSYGVKGKKAYGGIG